MIKTIGSVTLGAVAGAAIYLLMFAERYESNAADSPATTFIADSVETARLTGPGAAGSRPTPELSAYQQAAQVSDPAVLEAALDRLLAEPFSAASQIEIRALFERLAAIDVRRALRLAQTPGFDVELIAGVFRAWAEADADAALQELAGVGNPSTQRAIAIALLDVLGSDAATIERIAAALPEHQRIDFNAMALARRAEDDPRGAINAALALRDTAARSSAALRVGAAWVHSDPIAAYTAGDTLPRELQLAYRNSVAREWAETDTAAFLSYANDQPALDDFLPGLMHAMAVDPERVYQVAAAHPALPIGEGFNTYVTVHRTAFTDLVMTDPDRAFRILETINDAERHRDLTNALAEAYGRSRPAEAVAWARSLQPRNAVLEASAIAYSTADFDQKLTWLDEFEDPVDLTPYARNPFIATWGYISYLMALRAGGHPDRAAIASQLLERGDERSMDLLGRMTNTWVGYDPGGALDWMLASGEIDPFIAANIGGQLAQRDAKAAAAYTERLPEELRMPWLQQIASEYARQDAAGATGWIAQFQGQPGYDDMLGQAIVQAAQTDPQSAAQMLLLASGEMQRNVAGSVASGWARSDLAGAARWAVGLRDASAREAALNTVGNSWAYRDPQAAQRWAANLPSGEVRDQALSAVLSQLTRDGFDTSIDPQIIGAIDSAGRRNQQAARIVTSIATHDPDRAESILERWVTDPVLRQQGEQAIAQSRENR
jgi:hypothetical protein